MKTTLLNSQVSWITALVTAMFLGLLASLSAQVYPLTENSWDNPEFVNRFLGSYGVATEIEPEISKAESVALQEVIPFLQADDFSSAVSALNSNIKPDSSAALDFTLANLYFQMGSNDLAERAYKTAIGKFPNFARAYRNLGQVLVQDGKFKDAIPMLVKALELQGSSGVLYGLLGYCYLNIDRMDLAIDSYRMAMVHMPDSKDWRIGLVHAQMLTGSYSEALPIISGLLEENPSDSSLLMTAANARIGMENYDEASSYLEFLRRIDKASTQAMLLLGDIYVSRSLPLLAFELYEEMLKSNPAALLPRYAFRITGGLLGAGATNLADQFLDGWKSSFQGEISDKDNLDLLTLGARIAMSKGDNQKALAAYQGILDLDPLNGRALFDVARIYWLDDDYESAQYYFERAAKIPEFTVDASIQQARMEVARNNFSVAAKLLQNAQRIKSQPHVEEYLQAVQRLVE